MNEDLYLVYIERINDIANSNGEYEYEFYFSKTPEVAWGEEWNQQCPSACDREALRPDGTTYHEIKILKTKIPIMCIEENSCFSCQDMVDGIVACAWEDISEYEEYPEPMRLVFKFGYSLEYVKNDLSKRDLSFED